MLSDSTWNQTIIFAMTVNSGFIIAVIFSLQKNIKDLFAGKKFVGVVLDVLFLIFCLWICLYTMFVVNNGVFSLFSIVGFLLGFAIGYYSFGYLVNKIFEISSKKIKKLLNK